MRQKIPKCFSHHVLICLVLSFQMAFGFPSTLYAEGNPTRQNHPKTNESQDANKEAVPPSQDLPIDHPFTLNASSPNSDNLKKLGQADLIWEEFLRANESASPWQWKFDPQDPAIDEDPFFLRHQKWMIQKEESEADPTLIGHRPNAGEEALAFETTPTNAQIHFTKLNQSLQIAEPLTPVAFTDEFIFFSLNDGADLFQRAAGKGHKTGEGLFFLSRKSIESHVSDRSPIPFFFLPLPGQGWTGAIESRELVQTDQLIIQNKENVSITLDLKDVESVMLAQELNLAMALAFSIQSAALAGANPTDPLSTLSKPNEAESAILPEAGTTAGFGMFFTARTTHFQLTQQGSKIQPPSLQTTPTGTTKPTTLQAKALAPLFRLLQTHPTLAAFFPQRAEAMDLHQSVQIPPHVYSTIIFITSVLTGMLMLSVVLKYAVPGIRNKVKSLREGDAPKSLKGRLLREGREIFDVYAHVSTTSFQIINIGFGTALEIFFDRFAPSVAAADHTLIRRFLNFTFYFARDSVKSTPVNAKTFFLGSVIIGGLESAVMFMNYFVLLPLIGRTVAPNMSPYWENKINHSLVSPPLENHIGVGDTLRKSLAAFQNGASRYASDSRQQIIEGVTKDVDQLLRARGRNPRSANTQSMRNRLIEEKTDKLLQQRGLPAQNTFLFDAHSLFNLVPTSLGFQPSLESATEEGFVLARRFALTQNALARAIEALRKQALERPSLDVREAIAILEETQQKTKLLSLSLLKGPEAFQTAKQLRQQLTLLSYEGPVEYAIRHLPAAWIATYSEMAARMAAIYFRHALYSYLDRDGMRLLEIPQSEVELVEKKAINQVLADMAQDDPQWGLRRQNEPSQKLIEEKGAEFSTRLFIEIQKATKRREERLASDNFTPPQHGLYTRRQLDQAFQNTQHSIQEFRRERRHLKKQALANDISSASSLNPPSTTNSNSNLSAPRNHNELRKQIFTRELARQVGLHLSTDHLTAEEKMPFDEMMAQIEIKAESLTRGEIQHNPGLQRYLDRVSAHERQKIELSMYGSYFLHCYKEATTEKLLIDSQSSMQPGRFQWLRQKKIILQSSFMTRVLRTLETLTDDQALELGFNGALRRNIPMYHDLTSTHRRLIKKFIPNVSIIFLWNYFMWQVPMSYGAWLLMVASSGVAIDMPSQVINRAFRTNGFQVMKSFSSKIAFDLPSLSFTFLSPLILSLFVADANRLVQNYLTDPVLSFAAMLEPHDWTKVGFILASLGLTAKMYQWGRSTYQKYRFNKDFEKAMEAREHYAENEKHLTVKETLKLINPSVVFMRCWERIHH